MSLMFNNFLIPSPPSVFMRAMYGISIASLAYFGFSEVIGNHLQYSKFWNISSHKAVIKTKEIKISSRTGMLVLYTPAFLAGFLSLGLCYNDGLRFILVDLALTIHFFKRIYEGKHMQYSKFWNVNNFQKTVTKGKEIKLSSRTGMLFLYTPAFLAGLFSLSLFSNDGLRFLLVDLALTIHFFKRVYEVLFIHKYSGAMLLDSAILISLSYFISTATMIYNQHLSHTMPEPSLDLKYAGVALFFIGIIGNFYHHTILANLRQKDDEVYKIPKGGLFNLVICPHYLFEILIFVGICFISQTIYPFSFTAGTALYLMGRSYATRKWYLSKFPNFPKDVKALIPFIF
ncbi:hypothetical protein IFM89_016269 [Coptis chinensis]|uniref:3-oxo-5-alpha-steroid 4-dehydrogenase C-terminal domain-containing protein n=1 Tax=Coptis chinensis TaxID=261450 RepID=A0A835H3M0_9MAGN|nr:hypothetical protein IFM89_016269 [Coptis chinensis]